MLWQTLFLCGSSSDFQPRLMTSFRSQSLQLSAISEERGSPMHKITQLSFCSSTLVSLSAFIGFFSCSFTTLWGDSFVWRSSSRELRARAHVFCYWLHILSTLIPIVWSVWCWNWQAYTVKSLHSAFKGTGVNYDELQTDIRTDGRTDRPSYWDARTHLKMG